MAGKIKYRIFAVASRYDQLLRTSPGSEGSKDKRLSGAILGLPSFLFSVICLFFLLLTSSLSAQTTDYFFDRFQLNIAGEYYFKNRAFAFASLQSRYFDRTKLNNTVLGSNTDAYLLGFEWRYGERWYHRLGYQGEEYPTGHTRNLFTRIGHVGNISKLELIKQLGIGHISNSSSSNAQSLDFAVAVVYPFPFFKEMLLRPALSVFARKDYEVEQLQGTIKRPFDVGIYRADLNLFSKNREWQFNLHYFHEVRYFVIQTSSKNVDYNLVSPTYGATVRYYFDKHNITNKLLKWW